MSTQYYRIPSDLTINSDIKDLTGIEKYNYFHRSDFYVHIGINRVGWVFLFDSNNWKYYKDKEDLINFLKSGLILDEYNRTHNFEDIKWIFDKKGKTESSYIVKDGLFFEDFNY